MAEAIDQLLATGVELRAKGSPVDVFRGPATVTGRSVVAVDARASNALSITAIVSGTGISAVLVVEGSDAEGGAFTALSDPAASRTITASESWTVPIGTPFGKMNLTALSGTFLPGQGIQVIVTPFIQGGSSTINISNTAAQNLSQIAATTLAVPPDLDSAGTTSYNPGVGILVPASGGPATIQGDATNGLDVDVTRVNGGVASGAADSGTPVKVGGVFNTTPATVTNGQRVDIQADNQGRLLSRIVDASGNPIFIAATPGVVGGNVASGVADSGNPVKVAGRYNLTPPTFADGQRADLQTDANGQLKITSTITATLAQKYNATLPSPADGTAIDFQADSRGRLRSIVEGAAGTQLFLAASPGVIGGNVAHDAADSGNPVKVGGKYVATPAAVSTDGDRTDFITDSAGRLLVVDTGNVASGATDSGNPVKTGAVYNSTPPTFTNGQRADAQADVSGNLKAGLFGSTGAAILPNAATPAIATANPTVSKIATFPHLYNQVTWDPEAGPADWTALASAARTVATASATMVNYGWRGIVVAMYVTAKAAATTFSMQLYGVDGTTANLIALATVTAIPAAINTGYLITYYPGVIAADMVDAFAKNVALPRSFVVRLVPSDANSVTYSVGISGVL